MNYSSFLFDEEKELKPYQSIEEIKNSQDIESFLYTNLKINNIQENMLKIIINFSKKEKNEYLNEMIYDLINYNKEYDKETNHFTIKKKVSNFKYKLFQSLQKNVYEVVNVENKEKRKEIINRIYWWYRDKMKCFNELKYITKKTYIAPNEFDDEKYVNNKFKSLIQKNNIFISQTDKIKNDMNHRSIEIFDKKLLEDFKTKHILDADKKIIKYKVNPFIQSIRGIKAKKNNLSSKLKNINTENDISLPLLNYSLLQIDKKLMENKNKMNMEKRNQEDIQNNIEQFGVNKAKYKSSSLNKYEIKKLVNSYIKANNFKTLFINKNKHKIKNERYNNDNDNDNEINEELSRTKTKLKLDISHIINLNQDKNDIGNNNLINEMPARGKKRMKSQLVKISRDIFKKMGKKIILEDIKNLNYKTNKIIDKEKEKIIYKEIILKCPTNKINNEKAILNKCTKFKKLPPDSLSKLYFHNDIFKQKILYKKIINISTKKEEKNETNINEKLLDKNVFGDRYELIDHKSNRNVGKFNLSVYNMNNLEKIKNFKLKNKETKENTSNYKIYKINNVYKLYKNNYLNLRKSISDFRKKEYEGLLNKISKCKSRENEESQKNDKDNIDILYNLNDKLLFKNKISNLNKEKKHKYLSSAILNPDESNNFSQYYLPRSGSMLLTREKGN